MPERSPSALSAPGVLMFLMALATHPSIAQDAPTIGQRIQQAQQSGATERRAARAEKEAAWARAAAGRTDITVRGLGLYLSLPALEAALRAETLSIIPERRPDWSPPAYGQYHETVRLSDGSELSATFTSTQSGTVAGAIGYVQTLREGPSLEGLVEEFIKRWGPPDETHAQGTWLTWHLRSRVPTPNGLGAMLRAVVNLDRERTRVSRYTLSLNDYSFLRDDESRMVEARRSDALRQQESRKSGGVRF